MFNGGGMVMATVTVITGGGVVSALVLPQAR